MRVFKNIEEVRAELTRKQRECLDAQLRYQRIVAMFEEGMTASEIAREMRVKTTKRMAADAAIQQAAMKFAYADALQMCIDINEEAELPGTPVAIAQWTKKEIVHGDTVTDFKGIEWKFDRVSRVPAGNSEGRVLVIDDFGRSREFFPSVFNIQIVSNMEVAR